MSDNRTPSTPSTQHAALSTQHLVLNGYLGRLVKAWDWRSAALSFTLICAEAMLVSLAVGLIEAPGTVARAGAGGIPPLAILVVMVVAAAIPRLVEAFQLWSPDYEVAIGGGIILTLAGLLYTGAFRQYTPWNPEWFRQAVHAYIFRPTTAQSSVWLITIVIVYTWARGRLRETPSLDTTYTMLRVGVLVVAVTTILTVTAQEANSSGRANVRILVVTFFFFALSAVTLARLQIEGLRAQGRLGPQWIGPLVLPVALILIVGLLTAAVLSHTFLQTVTAILHPLFVVLNLILNVIIAIISWIAYLFYLVLSSVVNKITGGKVANLPTIAAPPRQVANQANHTVATLPDSIRFMLLAIVFVGIIWLLTRFIFRRPTRRQRGNEERESVMDWNEVGAGLKGILANLAARLRRKGTDPWADLRGDPRWQYTLKVRTLYSRLLHRGARAGVPRIPSAAPREHVPPLEGVYPHASAPLLTITDLYRAARYSDRPATVDDATAAETAFRTITNDHASKTEKSPASHGTP
ncbi:MAG: DUF4129 domain-containing protein [Thermomicrobiales bacterium]